MFRQVDFNREGVYRDRNGSQLVTAGGRMPLNFHQLGVAQWMG